MPRPLFVAMEAAAAAAAAQAVVVKGRRGEIDRTRSARTASLKVVVEGLKVKPTNEGFGNDSAALFKKAGQMTQNFALGVLNHQDGQNFYEVYYVNGRRIESTLHIVR